jgi:protein phosphatase
MAELISNRIKVEGRSDVGCVRSLNEDSIRINPEAGLIIVADGMGGHDAGEVASAQVIETIASTLRDTSNLTINLQGGDEDTITMAIGAAELDEEDDPTLDDVPNPIIARVTSAIGEANLAVNKVNQNKGYPEGTGMGSTVVGLWLPAFSDQPVIFHVGDSRLYLLRRRRLIQITQDHTLYEQWATFGGSGDPPAKNILLQAMGPSRSVTPDVRFQYIKQGDVLLLCSDGLTGMVPDPLLEKILANITPDTLAEVSDQLVETAKKRGGKDNISLILGYVVL